MNISVVVTEIPMVGIFLYELQRKETHSYILDLISCTNNIQEWQQDFMEDISKVVSKNDNFLETINEEVVSFLALKKKYFVCFKFYFLGATKAITEQHSNGDC